MTIMKSGLTVTLVLLSLAGCGDNSPESKLNDIDALLEKKFHMTEEQKSQVEKFVGEGKQLLENGKKEESSQAFTDALKILKLAEDAAMFNKSE